ncbi:MAG: DUF2442 domain-containing protein [Burkholderiales bacterium]
MIKITKADYLGNFCIRLFFSNGVQGDFDAADMLRGMGSLLMPLRDMAYFGEFFLELGALCWRNGLELSPDSLYRKLEESKLLKKEQAAA